MKNVTTLQDKARMANAMMDDFDFDLDDEFTVTASTSRAQPELKQDNTSLSLRDFDEYLVYLSPLVYANNEAKKICDAQLITCFGANIFVGSAFQLDLFQKALIEHNVGIPMDQICELCFREEEYIRSVAFAYMKQQLSRNMSVGSWVWTNRSITNILQLFGCGNLCVPCEESELWSLESSKVRSRDALPVDVYIENEAHDLMGVFLQLVELSYSRHHTGVVTTIEGRLDAARLLVLLLRLSCDATIQELHPGAVWGASEAVLAHCRRLEVAERPARSIAVVNVSAEHAEHAEHVSESAVDTDIASISNAVEFGPVPSAPSPPPLAADSYSDCSFRSPSQRDISPNFSPLPLRTAQLTSATPTALSLQSPHRLPKHTESEEEEERDALMSESQDQEESQLSSQLHAAASICASPSLDAYVDAEEGAVDNNAKGSAVDGSEGSGGSEGGAQGLVEEGVHDAVTTKDLKRNIFPEANAKSPLPLPGQDTPEVDEEVDEVVFAYSTEEVRAVQAGGMSLVLLQTLVSMVRCRDVSLLSLVNAAQVLSVSGHPAYQGLWKFFVRAILQYRVAPYFPDLPHVVVPCVDTEGSSSSTSGKRTSNGGTDDSGNSISICTCLTSYVNELTGQERAHKLKSDTLSMWRDLWAVRGFFKLVAQYVLHLGEVIDSDEFEDLEKACKKFREKTTCMEMEDVLDSIRDVCVLYLD